MLDIFVLGARLRVSLLFPATLIWLLAADRTGLSAFGFAAAVLHECGHLTALLLLGGRPSCLHFSFFGMNMTLAADHPLSAARQAAVAAAGPLVNLGCAALLWAADAPPVYAMLHMALFAFNMLPVLPLDGGRLLYALLGMRFDVACTARIMTVVAVLVFVPLLTLGALVLLQGGYNFTLLAGALYIGLLMITRRED